MKTIPVRVFKDVEIAVADDVDGLSEENRYAACRKAGIPAGLSVGWKCVVELPGPGKVHPPFFCADGRYGDA